MKPLYEGHPVEQKFQGKIWAEIGEKGASALTCWVAKSRLSERRLLNISKYIGDSSEGSPCSRACHLDDWPLHS